MIHSSDLTQPAAELRWMEYTVRLLVPEARLHDGDETMAARYERLAAEAVTLDVTASTPIGRGGVCAECGQVLIDTDGFPWGRSHYGNRETYCPHCDGAEDIE